MDATTCPVVILAGGKSRRLGRDKASEVLAGKTLLQRAIDASATLASLYVIVTARGRQIPAIDSAVPVSTVEDSYPETGPLGGIYTGLSALTPGPQDQTSPLLQRQAGGRGEGFPALVLACDLPLLQPLLLRELLRLAPGHDAVVPVKDGLPEPLCAVYSTRCVEPARRLLERGAYKVAGLFDDVDTLLVPESHWRTLDRDGLSFLNVNHEEDLLRAHALIENPGHIDG